MTTFPVDRANFPAWSPDYLQDTGKRLFTIKGKNALFERTDQVGTGSRWHRGQAGGTAIKRSGLLSVYALIKSVTIVWHDLQILTIEEENG
jgi:hypothetical protein